MPKSQLGVDVEHNFEITYEVNEKAQKVLKELRKESKKIDEIYLATDLDREGEAISWHLYELLRDKKNKNQVFRRVIFHEITKEEIENSFKNPSELNFDLVDAQQARRVLDRLVGYKLSPLLWKKVRYGLSAGRVQSVAVRLIVERERERQAFNPEEYWSVPAIFSKQNNKNSEFNSELIEFNGKKLEIKNETEVKEILENLKKSSSYEVTDVSKNSRKRNPYPPLKTSTLQQSSANVYGFNAKRTMSIAQKLFEKGHITYHRTDSLNLSEKFITEARDFIKKEIGKNYLPLEANTYKTSSKGAQEAHEAIRPTTLNPSPKGLTDDEYKIYSLIFKRALESQMLPVEFLQTTIKISSSNKYLFKSTGSIITFDGWLALTKKINIVEEEDELNELPQLNIGDQLDLININPKQHFTQPPARFSDATLIKTLEEMQIGRPSTYAPTISTIQERGYVKKEGRYFVPDDVAFVVTDLLVKFFPEIVDYNFTAEMEEKFDEIAEGKLKWVGVISQFYKPFEVNVKERDKELNKADFTFLGMSEEDCPKCGKKLMLKLGKFGKFLSCSGYPDCEFAKPIDSEGIDEQGNPIEYEKCEKCGGSMVLKMGRFGKFLACSNFPKCKNIKKFLNKIGMTCPLCKDGEVIVKKFRGREFFGCSKYPDCKYTSSKNPLLQNEEKVGEDE
ncbi:MAG: type I DNA topoisomerase [Proteobacteria bacterium]|nr:type I DNA topoisomerase [Pseudomonadota bacterium]